ncbi:MAG: cation transporter [Bacteroidetes bacterium]|nr:cation transporter [Bacteroidota bacterium]MBU1678866.1 cation transporter [Bacteroidota bacterium]MBU2505814.1 cation transporter [Bacteroidota bacterium]
MQEKEFKIEGMNCQHCVLAVETELKDAGFEKITVKKGSAKILFDHSKESDEKIAKAIEEAGFLVV